VSDCFQALIEPLDFSFILGTKQWVFDGGLSSTFIVYNLPPKLAIGDSVDERLARTPPQLAKKRISRFQVTWIN
jgi:hypothetical protein